MDLSNLIIKPERCAFAFGIPTSWEGYCSTSEYSERDFVKSSHLSAQEYFRSIISPSQRSIKLMRALGMTVVADCTLGEFGELFTRNEFDVIVLFSHHREADKTIEFWDGMFTTEDIISQIPEEYNRILDLCVCSPLWQIMKIREVRPNALYRTIAHPAPASVWLRLFPALFTLLHERNLGYKNAFDIVIQELLKVT